MQVDQVGPDVSESRTSEVALAVPDADPPESPAKAVVISEVDRLKAENVNLRLMNAVNRISLAQRTLNDAMGDHSKCLEAYRAFALDLETRYGINLTTHTVRELDGVVLPRA